MKIGVISDTHGDVESWRQVLAGPFQAVELILHAGDILYHGPKNPMVAGYRPAGLAEEINSCPVPIIFARGNCDSPVDQLVIDYPIQSPYAFVQVEGVRILVNHGDGLSRQEMVEQAKRHRADVFIFGHTHTPLLEKEQETLLLNPGSPALPKASPPTVGLLDTRARTAFLVNLTSGLVLEQMKF